MIHELEKDGIIASDDPARVDIALLHDFLKQSYWAKNIPLSVVEESVRNSLSMGLYAESGMIGYARAVTDYATFAYLGDVFVLEDWRGKGLGLWVSQCLVEHPRLRGLRRWMLATLDAHGVYAKLGFKPLDDPSAIMTMHDPEIYKR